jgi:hypothetical protein
MARWPKNNARRIQDTGYKKTEVVSHRARGVFQTGSTRHRDGGQAGSTEIIFCLSGRKPEGFLIKKSKHSCDDVTIGRTRPQCTGNAIKKTHSFSVSSHRAGGTSGVETPTGRNLETEKRSGRSGKLVYFWFFYCYMIAIFQFSVFHHSNVPTFHYSRICYLALGLGYCSSDLCGSDL